MKFPKKGAVKFQIFQPLTPDAWNFQGRQISKKDKMWQNLGIKMGGPPQMGPQKFLIFKPLQLDGSNFRNGYMFKLN